eukprot:1184230-Prorocentrum_minimum.AAC.2
MLAKRRGYMCLAEGCVSLRFPLIPSSGDGSRTRNATDIIKPGPVKAQSLRQLNPWCGSLSPLWFRVKRELGEMGGVWRPTTMSAYVGVGGKGGSSSS